MKKQILALGILFSFAGAPAAMADENTGCGLGANIMKGKSGLVPHIIAATLNGISGNQTFGMTSGTSGCSVDGTVQLDKQQETFVAKNHEALSEDMARGQGEYLVAYARVLGCSDASAATFASATQAEYETIIGSATEAKTVLAATKKVVSQNPTLAASCQLI